ncbi:dehydratase [Candidatus Acidianus copahuensis]|uniref:Dehydratase n=1 Tax=Candidatus Acidianus copahuensis TaxID=1160895 RepID=A0A031LSA8_9CREN|nr:UxaA family hydrolase [Candidatus Acidianus copahuensis]EZQ10028.1 dehydratase [Candidatus Acidianus copahuensis]
MAKALIHEKEDNVGVLISDTKQGEEVEVFYIADKNPLTKVVSQDSIPLGHKIALRDIKQGEEVIKYGRIIGVATKDIKRGEHVHTHNLRSKRWSFPLRR